MGERKRERTVVLRLPPPLTHPRALGVAHTLRPALYCWQTLPGKYNHFCGGWYGAWPLHASRWKIAHVRMYKLRRGARRVCAAPPCMHRRVWTMCSVLFSGLYSAFAWPRRCVLVQAYVRHYVCSLPYGSLDRSRQVVFLLPPEVYGRAMLSSL